jgi:hypothetical protein
VKSIFIAAFASTPYSGPTHRRTVLSYLLHVMRLAMMVAAALAFFCGPAAAQSKKIEKDISLPPILAEFQKGKVTDFESKKPGLGYSTAYSRSGGRADVYIYGLGKTSIPSGPKNDVIAAQMAEAKAEIYSIQKVGGYSSVKIKRSFDIANSAGKPVFTCMSMQLVLRDLRATDSYLCLTGSANKFVKVRLTVGQGANSEKDARRFVSELAKIIPPR